MKKQYLLLIIAAIFLSSCDINIYDDPYDPRLNFVGAYEAEEYSETFDVLTVFELEILMDDDPFSNFIYLRNFYGYSIEVFARVDGNRFTIPRQETAGLIIEGTGSLNGGEVVMTYSVQDLRSSRANTDFCNTILFR